MLLFGSLRPDRFKPVIYELGIEAGSAGVLSLDLLDTKQPLRAKKVYL